MFKKNFSKFTSLLLGTIIIGGSIFMSNATVNAAGINGWKANASNWYYYKDGAKATGWLKDGTTWYYLNNNGAMAQGWLLYNSKWYYLNSNGSMAKGWLLNKSRWYYLNEDGAMVSNIAKDNWEAGADGIFIETHPSPAEAKSDGANMLRLDLLEGLLEKLVRIRVAINA